MPNYFTELQDGPSGPSYKVMDEEATSAIEAIVNEYGAKNVLPITLEGLKAINTGGTWNGNAFTDYGVTFTIYTNNAGFVTSISATGTATLGNERLYIARNATDLNKYSGMILRGSDNSGDCGILIGNSQSTYAECKGADTTIGNIPANEQNTLWLNIYPQKTVNGAVFYPMIRDARITDPTYVPYAMTNRELTERVDAGSVYHGSTSLIWNSGDTITIPLPDKNRRGMLVSIVGNYPSNVSSLYYVGGGSQGYRVGALSENGTTLTYDGTNNVLIATKTSANADAVDVAVISISGIAG